GALTDQQHGIVQWHRDARGGRGRRLGGSAAERREQGEKRGETGHGWVLCGGIGFQGSRFRVQSAGMMQQREELARRGRRLEYFTILWNSLEGLVGITTGALAGSVSLVGFGVDSFIEVTSGAALLWRMSAETDRCQRERREVQTLKIVGACFLA